MRNIDKQLEIVNRGDVFTQEDSEFKFDFEDLPIKREMTYGRLCAILNVEPQEGDAKAMMIRDLKRFCRLKKFKNDHWEDRFSIEEIYDKPKKVKQKINDVRITQFKVSEEDWYKHGIYGVVKGKGIFVHSTYNNTFYEEFIRLCKYNRGAKNRKHATYPLHQGGDFIILDSIEDNLPVFTRDGRDGTMKKIKHNINNKTGYVVMNGRGVYHSSYLKLNIPTKNYYKAIECLIENDLI